MKHILRQAHYSYAVAMVAIVLLGVALSKVAMLNSTGVIGVPLRGTCSCSEQLTSLHCCLSEESETLSSARGRSGCAPEVTTLNMQCPSPYHPLMGAARTEQPLQHI